MNNVTGLKERVKSSADIVNVISKFIALKKKGVEYLALCPFHDERSPSFSVNPVKGIYKCFGCGASGDAIEFVKNFKHVGFMEALTIVAEIDNIEMELSVQSTQRGVLPQKSIIKSIPKDIVISSINKFEYNNFFWFIADLLRGDEAGAMDQLIKYFVGTAKGGYTVFWQIDQFQRARTASKILYKTDGHRDKGVEPRRVYTQGQGYGTCFFGEHLLLEAGREDLICLVESEKTAIIADLFIKELQGRKCVWLASSGNNGITEEKAQSLRGLNVCLVPDFSYMSRATWGLLPMCKKENEQGRSVPAEDGDIQKDYVSRATMLSRLGCKVSVYDPTPAVKDNSDLADLLIKQLAPVKIEEPDFDNLTI